MTARTTATSPPLVPEGAVRVAPGGLLGHVTRPCAKHRATGECVARRHEDACLVFWCAAGQHHFTVR